MKMVAVLPALAVMIVSVGASPQVKEAPTKTIDADIISRAGPGGFVHPGVFVGSEHIKRMASKVKDKKEPWTAAYHALEAHPFAIRTGPKPFSTVECGPTSTPNVGCTDETADAMAAYANALMWAATGKKGKAQQAIKFMNAWAKTIKAHTNKNAPLQAAWAAVDWVRAAEIIRYTGAGWREKDIKAFENMLRNVYLPLVKKGSTNPNNWALALDEATVSIAVFLGDRSTYDEAINRFIRNTAQYFYLSKDGDRPIKPDGMTYEYLDSKNVWNGQIARKLVDGMGMEICRDLKHTGYAIASVSHVMETSRIQGQDLYKEETGTRLREALEFQTMYDPNGGAAPVPEWLCNGTLSKNLDDVTEPGWSEWRDKRKGNMPNVLKFTRARRPARANSFFIGWETLTHAR
ncbi:proteinrelated to secreted protein- sviceus [Purpureocillium lavendulum]|uniref:Proteinrelated to secreted protein- sviceus n=1 Tax=Purpureocillium lavendulum TaxID=1247861 RepID=A0AB34FJG1_9HYPO|nr:proteinrelated to secreted protein- sviceus [Purpureocillium lavendulum]